MVSEQKGQDAPRWGLVLHIACASSALAGIATSKASTDTGPNLPSIFVLNLGPRVLV